MALYQKIVITDAGAALMSNILTSGGGPLTFEAIAVGSGQLPANASQATFSELISETKRLPIETVTGSGGIITVTARLATDTLTADLYHREIGVYANGILLAYGNTGEQYDYIPAAGKNAAVQKIIRVPLTIGTMQTAFAEMDSSDLLTHAALEARVATVIAPIARATVEAEAHNVLDETVLEIAKSASEKAAEDAYKAQALAEQAAANAINTKLEVQDVVDAAAEAAAEKATEDAYKAQILAEQAAAHALVSETNINKTLTEESTAATGWAWIYASPGAGGDYLMTIAGANIYTPDTSGTTTDAERLEIYVDRINAAQPYVTARAAEVPQEIGTGGYFFFLTATKPGTCGNVKLSGNTAAVKFSGDTLTGGRDSVANHMTAASCHVSPQDRAKWDTPLNAYQLFKGQKISAIPESEKLTKTLFAYQMCWDCKSLASIAGLQMPCVMNAYGAFYGCEALTDISDTTFSLSLNCAYMFANCKRLQTVGNANFAGAENCGEMFLNCTSLTSTGTSTFRHLRFAESMFAGCVNLEDITSMNLTRLTSAQSMFAQCILNLASLKHMAFYINQVAAAPITIGINAELQGNEELTTALATIRSRGWIVIEEYNVKTA